MSEEYFMVCNTSEEDAYGHPPVGFYDELMNAPIILVFTSRETAGRYMTSELGEASTGGRAILEIQPLDVGRFREMAKQIPEVFIGYDVTPDTPMPRAEDLTPIQEFVDSLE